MYSRVFFLNDEKTDFVAVRWDDGWKNTIVHRNRDKIGEIPEKKDLKFGKPLQSSDGKLLFIQLKYSLFGKPYLDLLVDGDHYDSREPTAEDKMFEIFVKVQVIGSIYLVLGLLSILSDIPYIYGFGFGLNSIIFGFIFSGLGLLFYLRKSIPAIIILTIIMCYEIVHFVVTNYNIDFIEVNFNGIVFRIGLIVLFIRGAWLLFQYKKENNNESQQKQEQLHLN